MSIALLAGLLLISLTAAFSYLKRQERLAQRYHLLCEVLKPGMSKDEVLNILDQVGDFLVLGTEEPGPHIELHVVFTDSIGKDVYGAFDLSFKDYKYVSAYVRGFENSNVICDFHTQIRSTTATYSP